jgi:signal transduction histidine kinase
MDGITCRGRRHPRRPARLDGQPRRLVFLSDITERKQAAERMRAANAALEQANQAKSEFLATMSHEIRTPLNGVIGLTSLLLGTALSPAQQEYASGIQASAVTLLILINDALNFAKIEAGQMTLEVRPLDPRQLVHDVVAVFRTQAQARGLQLDTQVAPAVPPVLWGAAVAREQGRQPRCRLSVRGVPQTLCGGRSPVSHAGLA